MLSLGLRQGERERKKKKEKGKDRKRKREKGLVEESLYRLSMLGFF